MIAYLIGGPQDMVKLIVPDDQSVVTFAHRAVVPANLGSSLPGKVQIRNTMYRKVYEHYGRDLFVIFAIFAIFVMFADD